MYWFADSARNARVFSVRNPALPSLSARNGRLSKLNPVWFNCRDELAKQETNDFRYAASLLWLEDRRLDLPMNTEKTLYCWLGIVVG